MADAIPDPTTNPMADQMTETMSASPVTGVIAHEIRHVVRRTPPARCFTTRRPVLVAALAGDVSGVAAFGPDAARSLGMLRYSRENEDEADEGGMRMIVAAGIDPAGMIAFSAVLAREGPTLPRSLNYLSTHPATAARVERLRTVARGVAPRVSLGSPEEWSAITERCRAASPTAAP